MGPSVQIYILLGHGFNGKNKDNKKVKKSGAKKQWTMADVKKGCTKSKQQKQAAKTEKTITNLMQKLKMMVPITPTMSQRLRV